MPLSDTAIRKARAKEKAYKLSDFEGLYVYVGPNGSKLWRMDYQFQGKRRTLSFGAYPAVTLAEARSKRDEAKNLLRKSIDPSLQRKREKIVEEIKAATTFKSVAEEYLDKMRKKQAAATIVKKEWLLRDLAYPQLGEMPIADITPMDVLNLLSAYERKGLLETANRLKQTIAAVFRLAVATLRATTDPTFSLKGAISPAVPTSYAAITNEKKFGILMATIDEYDGWPSVRGILQFIALTACRPGEVRLAQWDEFDLPNAKWTIPAPRTKMRRPHEVPLSKQALAVLDDMKQFCGERIVFPAVRTAIKPLSENAMNAALKRMGYTTQEHVSHGFRSSFSTIMNERGHDPEIIERALAHADGTVRGIYNRSRYWDARVKMMQTWADLIDEMKKPA